MPVRTRLATGLQLLLLLARDAEGRHTSEGLAETLRTNPVVVRRILAQLQQAELVHSHKGPTGGSELARPAREITLADAFSALGQTNLPELHSNAKSAAEMQALQQAFTAAEKAFLGSLESASLQSILQKANRTRGKAPAKTRKG